MASTSAGIVLRVLRQCCDEVESRGPWQWQCLARNGGLLSIAASLGDGFLHLAYRPWDTERSALFLERALRANRTLPGGVKLALGQHGNDLHLHCDLPLVDDEQLRNSFERALNGFHEGGAALRAANEGSSSVCDTTNPDGLKDLLNKVAWPHSERGTNDFSAELDAEGARPASLRLSDRDLEANVELFRSKAPSTAVRRALAAFLLSASGALCMVRAYSESAGDQELYGFQVSLSKAPAPEEVQDALAALSIAHRICAREANVLLTETAAQQYLAARCFSTANQLGEEE